MIFLVVSTVMPSNTESWFSSEIGYKRKQEKKSRYREKQFLLNAIIYYQHFLTYVTDSW